MNVPNSRPDVEVIIRNKRPSKRNIYSGFYDFSYGDKNYHVHQCLCEFKYVLHEFERVTTDTKRCKYCRMMISEPSKEN